MVRFGLDIGACDCVSHGKPKSRRVRKFFRSELDPREQKRFRLAPIG
jgi:hypothetical protein